MMKESDRSYPPKRETRAYRAAKAVLDNIAKYHEDYGEFPDVEDVAEDIQRYFRRNP